MRFLPGAHSCWLAPIGAVGVALCGIAADDVAARATQDTTLTAVLRRAGAYVSAYKRQLGSVVADEHYVQRINEPIGRVLRRGRRSARVPGSSAGSARR